MSTPRDFMERVVAWPAEGEAAFVNLHWNSQRVNMAGRPFTKLDDLMGLVQWGAVNPSAMKDIWFCTSTQSTTSKSKATGKIIAVRNADMALKFKAIWIDVDVKKEKGYATIVEAINAVGAFVAGSNLPQPSALVLSGGGTHVYWISDRALTTAEWRPYAAGLRAEAERLGLKCDYGLTTDAARLLRVPGTYNHKTVPPKAVRLAHLGASYDFATTPGLSGLAALAPAAVTAPVTAEAAFDLSGFSGKMAAAFSHLDPHDSLSAGINTYDPTPLNPDAVFLYCPHFRRAALEHGRGSPQGLWMLDMLATTFMDGGRRWGHFLSRGYVSYSRDETDKMYDRKVRDRESAGLGWPSCSAFENEGCKDCKGCPYHGKIRSPLNLAERAQPAQPAPQVVQAPLAPLPPEDMDELPTGYVYGSDGIINEIGQEDGENGQLVDRLYPLFMSHLRRFKVSGSHTGGAGSLGFQVETNPGVWKDVSVPCVEMSTEQSLMKCLRSQDVKPNPPHKRRIELFMTSFMAKVDAERQRLDTIPYGWVHKGNTKVGFSYGGILMKNDGTQTSAGIADAKLASVYSPAGSIDPWFEALKIVTDQKHPALEAIIALSFAAPLMHATGLYNGILHAWSDEGGAHKTTSIAIGLAVWASPQGAKENKMTSPKAMLKKLGELKNLPMYWDEINRVEQLKPVQQFLDVATEGRGGLTLTQNREFRDPGSWESLVCVGANVSLYEFVKRNTQNTDAQLQRIFEIKVEKRADTANPLVVSNLIESLNRNYGQMGMRYAALLANQGPAIEQYVKDVWNAFSDRVKIGDYLPSEERFRAALAATMYAGAKLANTLGASFNENLLYAYLVDEFLKQRKQINDMSPIAGTMINTSDELSKFFDTVTRNVMWVDKFHTGRGKPAPLTVLQGPKMEDPVFVRCIVNTKPPLVQISKDKFDAFLREKNTSIGTVYSGLKKHFGATITRLSLTAGTSRVGGRGEVVSIPAAGGMLYEFCFKQTPPDQRPPEEALSREEPIAGDAALQSAVTQAAADHAVVDAAGGATGAAQ